MKETEMQGRARKYETDDVVRRTLHELWAMWHDGHPYDEMVKRKLEWLQSAIYAERKDEKEFAREELLSAAKELRSFEAPVTRKQVAEWLEMRANG